MSSLPVSRRLSLVEPSATVAITSKAAELRAKGIDVISMSAGEPAATTPDHICEAAIEAMRDGDTHYTPVGGTPALRDAIRQKFLRDNGLNYEDAEVLASSGGKELCYLVCQALLDPGDNGIVIAPYWVSYPAVIRLAEAEVRVVETDPEQHYLPDPAAIDAMIDERSKIIFINSPSNPTGVVYGRQLLLALGEVLTAYPNLLIVSDEIYEPLVWGEEASLSIAKLCPALKARTLTLNGLSKAHAMTGWRLGYAGGPATLISQLKRLQRQTTTHPSSLSQAAGVAALNGPNDFVAAELIGYQRKLGLVKRAVDKVESISMVEPNGAFYAMLDVRELMAHIGLASDVDLCAALLDTARVACVPGTAFGAPGRIRISFAAADDAVSEGLNRICDFAAKAATTT